MKAIKNIFWSAILFLGYVATVFYIARGVEQFHGPFTENIMSNLIAMVLVCFALCSSISLTITTQKKEI
jgi:hypothetical protein